jgi:replicative DNA helicase
VARAPDHAPGAEESILGAILHWPQLIDQPGLAALEPGHFYAPKHRVVFAAMRNLRAANRPIDVVTVEGEIAHAGHLEAIGGVAFLGELSCRVPIVDNAIDYVRTVQTHARNRQAMMVISEALTRAQGWQHEPSELVSELRGEIDRALAKLEAGSTAREPQWVQLPDLVDVIRARSEEPWASLKLGDDELVEIRAGGIMVVMGPTGGGKTSLICSLVIEYAQRIGPVVVMSRELPADEFGARAIGAQCEASWVDVLKGKVSVDEMRHRADLPLVFIADRKNATLPVLEAMIKAAQAKAPGKLVLVVVDYLQIVESKEGDPRSKVADVVAQVDELLRAYRCVGVLISQMSRNASRESKNGDRVGAGTTDGGAESAAIERAATVTLCIGQSGAQREDGTCAVELSIGKHRMGGGDKVILASYNGRTGRWRITGPARPAGEVRDERTAARSSEAQAAAETLMNAAAERATAPLTRAALCTAARCKAAIARAGLTAMLERGELVEVRLKQPRSKSWKLWKPAKAAAAGIPLVSDGGDE